MNREKRDLPLDVIRAAKTIGDFMTDNGYLQTQITHIGILRFETKPGEFVIHTPIAQDMMLLTALAREDESPNDSRP